MLLEVDAYDSSHSITLEGAGYPARCLVEDRDGMRILLVPNGDPIPQHLWLRAHESGAQAIFRADTLAYILLEHFISDRQERGTGSAIAYAIPRTSWHPCVWVPSYVEMVDGSADAPPEGFVHLHTHTEFSALDGLSTVEEILEQVAADEQTAVAITDHGLCAGHPALQLAADKRGIKPIFGMEGYFRDDRLTREGDRYGYWHLILLAMDNDGLRNLWAMSTESYRDGLWQKPQIDWDTLQRLNGGIIATTACLGGPLLEPWARGDTERAVANLGRLQGIFGDRLYVEIQTTHEPQQITGNQWLVELARERGLPLVATSDSHYPRQADHHTHQTWLAVQTQKDVTDDLKLFSGGYQYHVMTEAEVRGALEYLPADVVEEAVANTTVIAGRCTAELVGKGHNPIYTRASADYPTREDRIRHDEELLFDLSMQGWSVRTEGKSYPPDVALARFEREFALVAKKGYCGYYLINWDLVTHAKENGVLVGPGRGSGGGSFVAYLVRIIEIDPIEHDLLFERFMTEGRTELPDFDVDYPSSKKQFMLAYAAKRWGEDHICAVGTHTRLQNKGALNDTSRALKSELPADIFVDSKALSAIIDAAEASTAGLGLSWEELWAQHGDLLEPYRQKYPELFAMAERLRGRLKTYSIHPAGVVIDTEEAITGSLPLRAGADGRMVAQFDMTALADLGFVKFDMLNIRNLDTIQGTVDLITERYGITVRPYDWVDEYHDPFVWDEISAGWTLGMFQIETTAGTRLTKRFKPQSIAELTDVITLVRPGPKNSGLTDQYFRRKEGDEDVTYPDQRMEALLGKTQGCMLYQEDILAVCMVIAGYGSDEADSVRKILGKKQVEKVEEAGRKFRRRAEENGTDPAVAALLWAQMAEFAKYCVSGDTQVWLAASGPSSDGTVTVRELYQRLHSQLPAYAHAGTPSGTRGRPASTFEGPCVSCGEYAQKYVRGYCLYKCDGWLQKFRAKGRGLYALSYYADGRIRPARILDVIQRGEEEVWRLTLADGKSITATANHRHLTPDGYRFVADLRPGDELIVDAGYESATPAEVARRMRLTTGFSRQEGAVNGHFGENNYAYIDGGSAVWKRWRHTHPQVCKQCGETDNVQLAHLDGNHQNNIESNYAWLCQSCHLKYDYARNNRVRRWQKGHRSEAIKIVAKQLMGEEPTYDVVMDAPHNFVANGIVTKNSFGKAHATAYALISYWTGWFKFHYTIQLICSALSSVKVERIPEFVGEARRLGFQVLPPDINMSQADFTAHQMDVRYGFMAIDGIGDAANAAVLKGQPYTSFEDFLERKGEKCNKGHIRKLVKLGVFDTLVPNRRGLEQLLDEDDLPAAQRCQSYSETVNDVGLPCVYDWANEPPEIGRSNKPKKPKPPPKKCTRACRQFNMRDPLDPLSVTPYTDADVRKIEIDTLGVFLSSTPFDRISAEDRETLATATDVLSGPPGAYVIACLLKSIRKREGRDGRMYAFLTLTTEMGELDCICFSKYLEKYESQMLIGGLALVGLTKNDRGQALDLYCSLEQ